MTDPSPIQELETGWLATTPPEDTYLRRFLLSWGNACAANARARGGTAQESPACILADSGSEVAYLNWAILQQPLLNETAPAMLAEIDAFYAFADPTRRGGVLLQSAWPTADLRPFGWYLVGHPPLHLLPTGATPRPAPDELHIEEVRGSAALFDWERVLVDGFPLEEAAGAPPGTVVTDAWLDDPRRRLWLGYVDDRPVTAASAWIEHGISNVTFVATLPEARRRGYGEAVTWAASLADPALPAMLFSSDDGRPVYQRMGYLPLFRMTLWYRARPS